LHIGNAQQDGWSCVEYPEQGEQGDDYVFKSSDIFSIYLAQIYNNIAIDFVNSRKKE